MNAFPNETQSYQRKVATLLQEYSFTEYIMSEYMGTDLYNSTLRMESKSSKFFENDPPSMAMLNIIYG